MTRTTRKQVESLFGTFANRLGMRVATRFDDHGAYRLDYAPVYGGYNIERIDDTSSGVSLPFGEQRRSAGEMWSAMHFALRAIEVHEKESAR